METQPQHISQIIDQHFESLQRLSVTDFETAYSHVWVWYSFRVSDTEELMIACNKALVSYCKSSQYALPKEFDGRLFKQWFESLGKHKQKRLLEDYLNDFFA